MVQAILRHQLYFPKQNMYVSRVAINTYLTTSTQGMWGYIDEISRKIFQNYYCLETQVRRKHYFVEQIHARMLPRRV